MNKEEKKSKENDKLKRYGIVAGQNAIFNFERWRSIQLKSWLKIENN